MRAVVLRRHGGPEVLEVVDRPDPEPGPGELLVDVGAAGVNFIDVYHRTGAYPVELPFVLGSEAAGTVAAVGEGVLGIEPGDRVAWAMRPGAYAQRAVVPAAVAVPVPAGVPDEDAAALLLQGMTAHYLTHSTYPVQPGDTVLVHAGAGGTGQLITQFVRLRGGDVIATVSTEEKERLAREAGAAEVIRYDRKDVVEEVRRITRGAGVAAVYDGVGAATFDASLASLRPRGMLALFGASSGPVPPVDPQRLNFGGSLFLTRPTLAHYMASREELLERSSAVLEGLASGDLRVRVGGRYGLDEVGRAHEDLESRRTTGKLIVLPD
ncbi:MAG TPA: quinone oxidoreductase [Mycobacteriales bacterium]|nr:quinone oxidoreductase [Mycobacteriales bacterium]